MTADIADLAFRVDSRDLDQAGRSLDSLTEKSGEVESATGRLERRFGEVGGRIQSVGTQMSLRFTAPIVAAGAASLKFAIDAGNAADRLLDLEEITGLSTDRLQEYEAVATRAGIASEAFESAAASLTNRLPQIRSGTGYAAEAMQALGIDVEDASGSLRSMDDLLPEILEGLADMENSAERNAAATQILGRSALALAPALAMGSDELRRVAQEARESGRVLSREALVAANAFREEWDDLTHGMRIARMELGMALMPLMSDFVGFLQSSVLPTVQGWVERFREIPVETQRMVAGLALVVAAAGPLLVITGTLIKSLGVVIGLSQTLLGVMTAKAAIFGAVAAAVAAVAIEIERKYTPGMEEVGRGAQVLNVLQRAWVILRETALGVGEVILGIGVTVTGAFRAMIAPLEGFARSASGMIQGVINRDWEALKNSASGLAGEITSSFQEAQRQMDQGIGFTTESLNTRIHNAVRETTALQDQLLTTARASSQSSNQARGSLLGVERATRSAVATMGQMAQAQVAVNDQTEIYIGLGAAEKVEEFEQRLLDQVEALQMQSLALRGGTRAVLEHELASLQAAGATEEQTARLQGLIDEVVEGEDALDRMRRQMAETSDQTGLLTNDLEGLEDQTGRAGEAFDGLAMVAERGLNRVSATLGAFMSGEIASFRDFASSLGGILQQGLSDMNTQVIQGLIDGQGIGGMGVFSLGAGLVSAAGQRMGGRTGGALSGLAGGAAMGAQLGGPIGAVIGGVLGGVAGFFGTDKDPKFQAGGDIGFASTGGRERERITTDLGDVLFRFRGMDSQQENAIRAGVREFDSVVAGILGDEFLAQATQAVRRDAFDSADDGDIRDLLKGRFDRIIGTFDGFISGLVRQEGELDKQVQMLSDLLDIRSMVAAGQGLGDLGFEELTGALMELRAAGETLGDTFIRVRGAFHEYAELAGSLVTSELTSGLNDFQRELVDIQGWGIQAARALNEKARAAGLEAARAEDMARVHEQVASRVAAVVGRMVDAGRSLAEGLFGSEASRLAEEIDRLRRGGASESQLASLLERQAELGREAEERQRFLQAQELSQIVADIAQVSGDSFADVADRLGFDLAELGDTLGFDADRLEGFLADLQVDPMALANEIDTMTARIVDELVLLPGSFADALGGVLRGEGAGAAPDGQDGATGGLPGGSPDDIARPVVAAGRETTEAVRAVETAIESLGGQQSAANEELVAVLGQLAAALGQRSNPRSTRTRTETA